MEHVAKTTNPRVTVGEIAALAHVGPSAVSNWRRRHKDFPLPVEESAAGDVFELHAVLAWLERHGKKFRKPEVEWDRVLWRACQQLRDNGLTLDDAIVLLLQLMLVRARTSSAPGAKTIQWQELWRTLSHIPHLALDRWERSLREIGSSDADLERALTLPSRIRGEDLVAAANQVAQVGDPDTDWGVLASELIQRYLDALGARGEFSTPQSVAALQVALLSPIGGTVYDPACGAAMVLAEVWRQRAAVSTVLYGQDVNEYSWRLGFLHLALNGADFTLETGDTLRDDRFRSLRADRVAVDPPLGAKAPGIEGSLDERWGFGVPRGSADWLWAQAALYHLADHGVAVMMMTPGALSRRGSEEWIRSEILRGGLLDAVIELPPGLLAGTSMPVVLLVFQRGRANRLDRVLFLDARQLGQPRRGRLHELEAQDIGRIVGAVQQWREGTLEEEARFSASATMDEILANGADLSPKRYVRFSTRVMSIEGEPIGARFDRLRGQAQALGAHAGASADQLIAELGGFTQGAPQPNDLVRLGDVLLAPPQTGTRHDPEGDGPAVPYIPTALVSGGSGRLEQVPEEVTRGKTRGRLARPGDVLLVSRGIDAAGRIGCATVDFNGEAAYSESLLRLSPDPGVADPGYLRLFLTSRQGRMALAAATTGSVIANLRGEALQEIEVPLPDLATQRQIVAATRRIEAGMRVLNDFLNTVQDTYDAVREGVVSGVLLPTAER